MKREITVCFVSNNSSTEIQNKWINTANSAYSEPHRHYHTLSHIHFMFDQLKDYTKIEQLSVNETQILHYAIWFHDIFYETRQSQILGRNEIQSTVTFKDFAEEVEVVNRLFTYRLIF